MRTIEHLTLLLIAILSAACSGGGGTGGTGEDTMAPADIVEDTVFVPGDTAGPPPDTTPPDTAPPDTTPSCAEDPGGPLCPCQENGDCNVGFCVPHLGDRVCTTECVEDCPEGFSCKESEGFGSDLVYLCWSDFPGLCLPCSQSAECPDQQHRCVLYPDGVGSFCGGACQPDQPEPDCPPGWECQVVTTMEGAEVPQCVLPGGECPCSEPAIADALGTHCYAINEHGVCSGWRVCTEDGLSPCDATDPGPEVCFNDVDEDCDGTKDDADTCCFPHCEGKECGNDGCGGSCGACLDTELCAGEGLCVCVPDCAGKQCGSDGCDGSCGDCPPQYACTGAGLCECVPDCAGKECGSDGCAGNCAVCPINHVCTEANTCVCVPNCADKECGDDGCGDPCGACVPGTICVFGACQDGCGGDGDCAFLEECVGGFCQPDVPDDAILAGTLLFETVPGQATPFVYGDVIEAGVTLAAGQGPGLMAQVGYGPPGFDPQANPQEWQWLATVYAGDAGDADRYKAELYQTTPGTWAWTFRFSLDGIHWVYADATGLGDGFATSALGSWKVLPPPQVSGVVPSRGTVLGGTTVFIQGANFVEGLTLTLDGAPLTPVSVASDVIQFITPSHARGPVNLTIENPSGQDLILPDHYRFVLKATPTMDGSLGDWDPLFRVGENGLESNWDPALNHADALYAAFDGVYLYLGVDGACEQFNYLLGYVDRDFGLGTGVGDLLGLSDNAGNGDLDDAISNILEVDVPGFGADHAFGSRGMASFAAGDPIDQSLHVGWRAVNDLPYDLPWLQGTVACSTTACEASFSLSTLYPGGIPPGGADVAVFIKLTDRYGNLEGLSNQTLPESWDPADPPKVDAVSTFKVF
ncbi:MAG: IPT/TIG domain-containing protein [Pseudomonadota bacterium]